MILHMILKSFNKIQTVFNYSSSPLESPDSLNVFDLLDTPDSLDNDYADGNNSILSFGGLVAIGVAFFLRSFSFTDLSCQFSVLRYFLVALLRISSFSYSFQAFLFPAIKHNLLWFYGS